MNARLREQRGWYVYDWANSAFASTVVTLFLGPYLTSVAKAAAGADGLVHPFGIPIEPRSWWGYLVAASVMLQVITLPIVGALADRTPRKKELLALCAYIGAGVTLAMYFISGTNYLFGGVLFLMANVAFGASIVVYNSFLPDIATEEERDRVSSRGWGIGYLGGGIVLALNLALFSNAETLGLTEAMAVRISLASAGIWWALFTLVPLATLKNRPPHKSASSSAGQFLSTLKGMRQYPRALTFLIAYLLYNDAVQAVITLSGQFGADELKMPMSSLTLAILMVQFLAFGGALGFNVISNRLGTKQTIVMALVIWIGVILYIFSAVRNTRDFFIAAGIVALVMGGTQALSRALFSTMIPKGKEGEYFAVYEISDKGTSWLAPLIFGLTLQFTGSYRIAILSLLVFFVAGLVVLLQVKPAAAVTDPDPPGGLVASGSES